LTGGTIKGILKNKKKKRKRKKNSGHYRRECLPYLWGMNPLAYFSLLFYI
jgi:hypothetical protein